MPVLAVALLLATVSIARADDDSCAYARHRDCGSATPGSDGDGFVLRPLRSRSLGRADGPRPTPQAPYQGLQAVAYPLARLGFFARSEGFSLARGRAINDVEGGAVLQLDEGLGLTAAYRLLGAEVGFDSMLLGAGGKAGIAAPFVAFVLDF
jgi:hypothetical protein